MESRTAMKHLLIVISWLALAALSQAEPRRPNIILILADDLGYADLGCYGNTFNETPHIDRLASQGIRFTHFYAGPVCSPTRCNLQSGQDQARFGITQHIPGHRRPYAKLIDPTVPRQMPSEVVTFAESAVSVGYRTGYFGKWHLGDGAYGPETQGWQEAEEIKGNVLKSGGQEHRAAEVITDRGLDFIRRHQDAPFLLQLAYAAVHIPLSTSPALIEKYRAKSAMAGYPSLPEYAGLLEELDTGVGRIMDAVDQAGLQGHTLILFLSDNGGLEHEQSGKVVTSNKPLRGEKGMLYEGGIRIPAIARYPGRIPAASECSVPLITMDVHPTVIALTGATTPAAQPCDGVSLLPWFDQPTAPPARDALYWHLPHYHHSTPASAIQRQGWKLLEFFEDGRLELYDLKHDPGESKNLAAAEPTLAADLLSALKAWRGKVGARMPTPNPDYDPERADQLAKGRLKE
jgi:arylsulfatase A